MSQLIGSVLGRLEENIDGALERLFSLLRIPSVSMEPARAEDCTRAARWLVEELSRLGFTADAHPSTGHPMVIARRKSRREGAPHVLFYGHYDVQPVDPLSLWHRDPFAPALVEDPVNGTMIVARGASDDKGQVMTFVEALRGWLEATGDIPLDVTLLIEGDEESDSRHAEGFLDTMGEQLRADVVWICDSGVWNRTTPAIVISLRGLASAEITVTGPNRDLHSGKYGGAALNPIRALAHALDALHDAEGRVTVPGFYDGIDEIPDFLAQNWSRLGFDPADFLGKVGLSKAVGEANRPVLQCLWSRPTAEINGFWGGYQGPGTKTVIPSSAHAKLSFRLAAGQRHANLYANLERHLKSNLPPDAKLTITTEGASPGVIVPESCPFLEPARRALAMEWGTTPALTGAGGSIPIVSMFKSKLGMDSILIGFSLEDDGAHSPNEKYNLESFARGSRTWARLIGEFA
jgi:acetylornithine deacetylase/succinyl-diaminopimelate desuccinylase-like protein